MSDTSVGVGENEPAAADAFIALMARADEPVTDRSVTGAMSSGAEEWVTAHTTRRSPRNPAVTSSKRRHPG